MGVGVGGVGGEERRVRWKLGRGGQEGVVVGCGRGGGGLRIRGWRGRDRWLEAVEGMGWLE